MLEAHMAKTRKSNTPTQLAEVQRGARRRTARTSATPLPKVKGKLGSLLQSIASGQGATLPELSTALGWQPHTTRAAISGLRKRGVAIELVKSPNGAASRYRLASAKPA
jgi:hypothetical protein